MSWNIFHAASALLKYDSVKARAWPIINKAATLDSGLNKLRSAEQLAADSIRSLYAACQLDQKLWPLKGMPVGEMGECKRHAPLLLQAGIRTAYDILARSTDGPVKLGAQASDTQLRKQTGLDVEVSRAALMGLQRVMPVVRASDRVMIDPDRMSDAERGLIVAVARYLSIREKLPAALEKQRLQLSRVEAGAAWIRGELGAPALRFDRARQLQLVAYCEALEPFVDRFDAGCEAELRQLSELPAEGPMEPLRRYSENNAWFHAALESLLPPAAPTAPSQAPAAQPTPATVRPVPVPGALPPMPRGPSVHGDLPSEVAQAVEATELQRGPIKASLRRYQQFGAQFIIAQRRTVLGDDMGLGKTVQALAAMCHLHATGKRHFLVIAPSGVLINWEREVAAHTGLASFVMHGVNRTEICKAWAAQGGVGIATFRGIELLIPHLPKIDMLTVDEAHNVKNPEAQRSRNVEDVAMRSNYVTLMSGTALENRLSELRQLVLLAQPELWQSMQYLIAWKTPAAPEVRRRIAPAYLRRTREDVLSELPEMVMVDEYVSLSPEELSKATAYGADMQGQRLAATAGNGAGVSAKYARLQELLEVYRASGDKVVIFSFFRKVLEDVAGICGCEQITGQVSSIERMRMIDRFRETPGFACLAIQVDAGGQGINLQFARVVVLMEPQFKPSTESQAIARVHRMGQGRKVMAHRLVAKGTIDEDLVELVSTKQAVFNEYAHQSSVKDASAMSVDAATVEPSVESEIRRRAGERGGPVSP